MVTSQRHQSNLSSISTSFLSAKINIYITISIQIIDFVFAKQEKVKNKSFLLMNLTRLLFSVKYY
nr:MAG TPA_asm: hypothetical protein [Caudoviricetes sp.]